MFEDFDETQTSAEDRRRMGSSLVASGVVLLALGAIGATMAVTTNIVRRADPQAEVTFENMPMEEAPPPPPREAPPPRPNRPQRAVQRQDMSAPTEIPDERPAESDDALVEAGETGPLDGEIGGTGDGDGTGNGVGASLGTAPVEPDEESRLAAIPQVAHEDIELPRRVGGCERPEYPQDARTRGLSDRVVVRVRIREDGTLAGIEFLRGDEIFRGAVRQCVEAMQWAPARLADGTAITHARTLTFPFRLTNL